MGGHRHQMANSTCPCTASTVPTISQTRRLRIRDPYILQRFTSFARPLFQNRQLRFAAFGTHLARGES